jgi:hypothetical protein
LYPALPFKRNDVQHSRKPNERECGKVMSGENFLKNKNAQKELHCG